MEAVLSIDAAERATILAALRYCQQQGQGDPSNRSDEIHDIATDGDNQISLDDEGIDVLCEKVNFGETPLMLDQVTQVVVFASKGVTRSVAVRDLPEGGVPCVVVDYDDMREHPHQEVGDFERERIGCTREEFDLAASYIW